MTRRITTGELAEQLRGTAAAIRTRLCRTGSYYGVVPDKLPSGRLLWPSDTVDQILARGRSAQVLAR
jgi:hypothetical protein